MVSCSPKGQKETGLKLLTPKVRKLEEDQHEFKSSLGYTVAFWSAGITVQNKILTQK